MGYKRIDLLDSSLRTVTVGNEDDDPLFSLCPGHVTRIVFIRSFLKEGWWDEDMAVREALRFEYWKQVDGLWEKSDINDTAAEPMTVMEWD
jgi:hypothetical protein